MTLLIFIIIPIAAGVAFGYEMGYNKIQWIPTVVADYDNTEFSRTLIDYIDESDIFQVTAQVNTDQELTDRIASGKALAGLIIPPGFSADMQAGRGPKVEVLYDGTMMTVASSAKAAMSEILMTAKAGFMKNIYEGKLSAVESQAMNQIQPVDATYRTLFNPAKNYRNFLLPGMLAAIMQVGFAIIGLSRSMEGHFGFVESLGKILGWGTLGALSLILCLGVQYVFFNMPYRGSVSAGLLLTLLFSLAMTTFGYIIGQMIPDRVFATQLTCVLVLPTSILGGYTFPLMAMPRFFQALGTVFPMTYYGESIRKLSLAHIGFPYFIPDLKALLLIFGGQLLILAAVTFVWRLRLKGQGLKKQGFIGAEAGLGAEGLSKSGPTEREVTGL